jgi:SAM-dependent methyltransferase
MVLHPQENPSLTIVTVSAFDSIRLRDTLLSLVEISNLNIEHLTVLPIEDHDSISLWREICNGKSNFRMLHDHNRGVYQAMNLGAAKARGKYLVFWNSGERLTSHREVIKLVETLEISESPQVITQGLIEWIPNHQQNEETYQRFISDDPRGFISHQTYFIQREVFNSLSGFSLKYKVVADTELILRMSGEEIQFEPSISPVFVESSAFAAFHHRRARIENLVMGFKFGLKHGNFHRFFNSVKNEVQSLGRRSMGIFEISSMGFFSSRSPSILPNPPSWADNFARTHILGVFHSDVISRLIGSTVKRIAIVGGTMHDPEAQLISQFYPDVEIETFGIESADSYFDLNLQNEVVRPKFDLVICSQVLEHVWNHENFFNNLANLTRIGGFIWVACPASNKFHGSPSYYSAGFTSEYLAINFKSRGVAEESMGGFGSKRLYLATHLIPGWLSRRAHALPMSFAFDERKSIVRWILRIRFSGFLLFLSLISPIQSTSPRWFTETWFLGKKLDS